MRSQRAVVDFVCAILRHFCARYHGHLGSPSPRLAPVCLLAALAQGLTLCMQSAALRVSPPSQTASAEQGVSYHRTGCSKANLDLACALSSAISVQEKLQ